VARQTLLLSIRQEYADAILDGRKTFELRRVKPDIRRGDRVVLYVTAPVSALCGHFLVDEVVTGSPTHIWGCVRSDAGVTRRQVYDYLRDARSPCAIRVRDAYRFKNSMPVEGIRQAWTEFRPPRSFRYVSPEVMAALGLSNGKRGRVAVAAYGDPREPDSVLGEA